MASDISTGGIRDHHNDPGSMPDLPADGFRFLGGPDRGQDRKVGPPPMALALDAADGALDDLQKVVERLVDRLRPVVANDRPALGPVPSPPRPGTSDVVTRVHAAAERIHDSVRALNHLHDGIEL